MHAALGGLGGGLELDEALVDRRALLVGAVAHDGREAARDRHLGGVLVVAVLRAHQLDVAKREHALGAAVAAITTTSAAAAAAERRHLARVLHLHRDLAADEPLAHELARLVAVRLRRPVAHARARRADRRELHAALGAAGVDVLDD